MAARARNDRQDQIKYFRTLWEKGRRGYILAMSSHIFALLEKNPTVAEQALRDSIEWRDTDQDKAIVYHSLGNLLSKDRSRWVEALELV